MWSKQATATWEPLEYWKCTALDPVQLGHEMPWLAWHLTHTRIVHGTAAIARTIQCQRHYGILLWTMQVTQMFEHWSIPMRVDAALESEKGFSDSAAHPNARIQ
jgi:hypothetical protein